MKKLWKRVSEFQLRIEFTTSIASSKVRFLPRTLEIFSKVSLLVAKQPSLTSLTHACIYRRSIFRNQITYSSVFYFSFLFLDPCKTEGCRAPYNVGCRVVNNRAQCICRSCRNFRKPVCSSDGVQDLTECHFKQQACQANLSITVRKQGPCGTVKLTGFTL